jgi:2'-5' RNA ligase
MRLFTAIDLSESARAALAGEQTRLARELGRHGDSSFRLVKPEQLHVTLVFIGEVADELVASIVDVVSVDIAMVPFRMVLRGIGVFPRRTPHRVLWVGVTEGARSVVELYGVLVARLARVGIRTDPRPFAPHLTLGRWRGAGGRLRDRSVLSAGGADEVDLCVDRVTLYRSDQSPAGATHTALAHARLTET